MPRLVPTFLAKFGRSKPGLQAGSSLQSVIDDPFGSLEADSPTQKDEVEEGEHIAKIFEPQRPRTIRRKLTLTIHRATWVVGPCCQPDLLCLVGLKG